MSWAFDEWNKGYTPEAFAELADLWNANAAECHAFYPWSGKLLAKLLASDGRPVGRMLEARDPAGQLAGFTHITMLGEEGYPRAGTVELLLVDSRFRKRGLGTALLQKAVQVLATQPEPPDFIDAMGAWPFGYAYNTLADGSERSGVFLRQADFYRLFRRAGFDPVRKSLVMRAELSRAAPRPLPPASGFYINRRRENTWLDRVFRGRELWDHDLTAAGKGLLSRAIFGFMPGESRQEGRAIFSLFGVNTPRDLQGRGYAGVNISHLMEYVRGLGGEVMELHAYADNVPALALYRGQGFVPVDETMMLHLRL